jgi:hypothetical protein
MKKSQLFYFSFIVILLVVSALSILLEAPLTAAEVPSIIIVNEFKFTPNISEKFKQEDHVKYTEVFEKLDLRCLINVKRALLSGPNLHGKIVIDYQLKIVPSEANNHRSNFTKQGSVFCDEGKACMAIRVPMEKVYPSDTIICTASVKQGNLEIPIGGISMGMPGFDLVINKVDAMNVISGPDLIAGKPHVVKSYVTFGSSIIDELDKKISVEFKQEGYWGGGTEPRIEGSWSFSDKEVVKYPSLAELRSIALNNRFEEIFPGVTVKEVLTSIKESNHTLNFFGKDTPLGEISHEGTWKFYSAIDTGDGEYGDVKESNENNNNIEGMPGNQTAQQSKTAIKQINDFKINVYLFYHSDSPRDMIGSDGLSPQGRRAYLQVRKNIDFAIAALPLNYENVNQNQIRYLPYQYDKDFVEQESGIGYDYSAGALGAFFTPSLYKKRILNQVSAWSEAERIKNGADLHVILISEKDLLDYGGSDAAGVTFPGARTVLLKFEDQVTYQQKWAESILLHEIGHAFLDLQEEYGGDDDGPPIEEEGWYFNQRNGRNLGARYNIWTEPDERDGAFRVSLDNPEYPNVNGMNLIMGARFTTMMGRSSKDDRWINSTIYNEFIETFKAEGILED